MDEIPVTASPAAGLTQWQRVAYAFSAPGRTFEDIRRGNRSWWLPLVVLSLAGYILFGVVAEQIGIRQAVVNQIQMSARSQDQLAQASPEQKEKMYRIGEGVTRVAFVASPALGMLYALAIAAVLMGTINFGFAGRARFSEVFAVVYYAWLPQLVKVLLGIVVIYAGMAPESFNMKNFAPTNVGAFLDPMDTNRALYALATACDAVTIWMAALMSIGVATVAGVKRSAGYIAVFGWWLIVVFFKVVTASLLG